MFSFLRTILHHPEKGCRGEMRPNHGEFIFATPEIRKIQIEV